MYRGSKRIELEENNQIEAKTEYMFISVLVMTLARLIIKRDVYVYFQA